jgi:hypothetical protein
MKKRLTKYFCEKNNIDLYTIKYEVEKELGVKIKPKNRRRHITDARKIFFFLANKHTKFNLAVLGGYLNRDHATALHNIRTAKILKETDTDFREKLYNLDKIVFRKKTNKYLKPIIQPQPKVIHPSIRYAQKSVRKILIKRRQTAKSSYVLSQS